jgi:multisubunit Na+/H+ antiporter MnhF subunit
MTTTSDQSRRTSVHWWLLAAAVTSCVFLLGSAWSLVAQLAVLVAAVHRLTRRPSKQEAVVLWAALAVIVVTLIAVAAISIATASVSGSFTSTTVPLD